MKLQMCRICLVDNVSLLPITKTPLQEIYENLTKMKLETNPRRPTYLCNVCYARLRNCYHLRNNCLRSEELLTLMLISNNKASAYKTKTNLNFLTRTPFIKVSCDTVYEKDEGSDNEDEIKMQATMTEEINIKTDKASDEMHVEDKVHSSDSDDDVPLTMINNKEKSKVQEKNGLRKRGDTAGKTKRTPTIFGHDSSKPKKMEYTEINNKEDKCNTTKVTLTGDTAGKTKGSPTIFGRHSRKPKKIKYTEINNKEDKCNTSKVILTRTVILEDKTVDEKPYKCDICNTQFRNSDSLRRHTVAIHTGKKVYPCDICNRLFIRPYDLLNHTRTHTGEKPYKCDVCNKLFSLVGGLRKHLRIHAVEKPYKCGYCNKMFNEDRHLTKHIRIHTGEKPYKCGYCYKMFNDDRNLTKHIRIHTGEKPYKCNVCSRRFSDNSTLRKHMPMHTRNKVYQCVICYKQFRVESYFQKHMRIHTNEN